MSARVSRWRALKQFRRDLEQWQSNAFHYESSSDDEEARAWIAVIENCIWMHDRIDKPNLAPSVPHCATRTVLVPWTVYKRLERQANAWHNARAKRKAQIRRMKK